MPDLQNIQTESDMSYKKNIPLSPYNKHLYWTKYQGLSKNTMSIEITISTLDKSEVI